MTANNRVFNIISKDDDVIQSASDLMRINNLDWDVTLNNVYASGRFDIIDIPNKFATVKTTKDGHESILSVVGSRYKPLQNTEIFSALDPIVETGEYQYGKAGELSGGKTVWAMIKLPEPLDVGGDEHMGYVIARTSHDGTSPFQLTPMMNRIACTNQINAMMMDGKKRGLYYSVRHTTNSYIDHKAIQLMFKNIKPSFNNYISISNILKGQSFADNDFQNFIRMVYPIPAHILNSNPDMLTPGQLRSRNRVLGLRASALKVWSGETGTMDGIVGTKFGAFQAIVEVADWNNSKRDKVESNIILGKDTDIKQRALELLKV
jgi:phage/plasmid-like protein (TIGR03299 family)